MNIVGLKAMGIFYNLPTLDNDLSICPVLPIKAVTEFPTLEEFELNPNQAKPTFLKEDWRSKGKRRLK